MAGILAIYQKEKLDERLLEKIRKLAFKLKHRGNNNRFIHKSFPLEVIFYKQKETKRDTPLNFSFDRKSNNLIVIDGQIYNFKEINEKYLGFNKEKHEQVNYNLEGIIQGYKKCGIQILNQLIGSFSGILYDGNKLFAFKDPIGAKPLYYCENDKLFICASELKALSPLKLKINPIKPGTAQVSLGNTSRFYHYPKFAKKYKLTKEITINFTNELRKLIKLAVNDNIRPGEKISCLLSGGLDSTIITNIAKNSVENLNVYTVGGDGSEDVVYAKKFAKLHNLNHKVIEVNLDTLLEFLPEVIFALETFDAALIRSSVPMFILSKYIKTDQGKCVLLTGEGGDELFGGYSYFSELDSPNLFNEEILKLLEIEHITGLQRVDRIPYFFSIEARAPLFDRRLVEFSFKIPTELKIFRKKDVGTAKKWILRKAFEKEIPDEFIWRKKKKFSHGAGSQFILRDYINNIISDNEFNDEKQITSNFSVRSKEELYYWRIFRSKFEPTLETISEIGITNIFEY